MSCVLYVGNYPSTLTSEDLLTLFQDFEGIELLRFLKKANKCYSFLQCVDQDQVVEVVMAMNDIDVCGRNLIVRASDDDTQAAIQQLIQESEGTSKYAGAASLEHGFTDYYSKSVSRNHENFSSKRNVSYDQRTPAVYSIHQNNGSTEQYKNERRLKDPNFYDSSQKVYQEYQQKNEIYDYKKNNDYEISYFPSTSVSNPEVDYSYRSNRSRYSFAHENSSPQSYDANAQHVGYYVDDKVKHIAYKQDLPFDSYATNVTEDSTNSIGLGTELCKDELFFVSVVNFPLGTPTSDLYMLFSDYNPFKIHVICNAPRADKTPTEAIVCFMSKKDATDAIINLDNTIYRRRVLLVTDAADLSLVPELLSFGGKDKGNTDKFKKGSHYKHCKIKTEY